MHLYIYHITTKEDLNHAKDFGLYEATSLKIEGFIHASTIDQVIFVANQVYRDVPNTILLEIDPDLLQSPVKWESEGIATRANEDDPMSPESQDMRDLQDMRDSQDLYLEPLKEEPEEEQFPHIYGAINLNAITRVLPLNQASDGLYQLPDNINNHQVPGFDDMHGHVAQIPDGDNA